MDFADLQMSCKVNVLTLRVGRLLVVDGAVSLAHLDIMSYFGFTRENKLSFLTLVIHGGDGWH